MAREAIVLTKRSEQRLARLIRKDNADRSGKGYGKSNRAASPPKVGRALTAINRNQLGTFILQRGLPGSFANSSQQFNAFALADFEMDELASLQYHIGENSGGYWAALHANADSTQSSSGGCICELIETLVTENAISTQAGDDLRAACGCAAQQPPPVAVVGCSTCNSNEMPALMEVALAGFVDGLDSEFWAPMAATLNNFHELDMVDGICGSTKTFNSFTNNSGFQLFTVMSMTLTHNDSGTEKFWVLGINLAIWITDPVTGGASPLGTQILTYRPIETQGNCKGSYAFGPADQVPPPFNNERYVDEANMTGIIRPKT